MERVKYEGENFEVQINQTTLCMLLNFGALVQILRTKVLITTKRL